MRQRAQAYKRTVAEWVEVGAIVRLLPLKHDIKTPLADRSVSARFVDL